MKEKDAFYFSFFGQKLDFGAFPHLHLKRNSACFCSAKRKAVQKNESFKKNEKSFELLFDFCYNDTI